MFSDESDSDYETTYSQDERIAKQLRYKRLQEEAEEEANEDRRKHRFDTIYEEKIDAVFHRAGLAFSKFTSKKIKFSFRPSAVVQLISENTVFSCTLVFHKYYWNVRRDTFPSSYKLRIYRIFYDGSVSDDEILRSIETIWKLLVSWSKTYEQLQHEKFMRYQNGEDIELNEEDELFLSEEERVKLVEKRKRITQRMIYPDGPKRWRLD